ncbi:MAG: polysulfide reductase NrfD [Alphaproteobacteria bacterium]|nr:polysulfide reductase NrfD [Alphaproteobacteria bacterium]
MVAEIYWGLPVIFYLFLAGLGAGALTVSAYVYLRGNGGAFGEDHVTVARYGAFLAPIPVIFGCWLLIFELGSFQVGDWFKWINLYLVINLSPMSIGTWLLTLFIGTSLVYACTFVPFMPMLGLNREGLKRALAWVNVPLGISVAVYTGVLLGAMAARPFWNTPLVALLFLLSSLSTGTALILFARAMLPGKGADAAAKKGFHHSNYLLTFSDTLLIGFEIVAIFLFLIFAYLTVGDVRHAISVIMLGGSLAVPFWIGVVAIGLILPALAELYYVVPKLVYHREFAVPRSIELIVPAAVIVGGFMLRYVVVIAGQITGPIGI